MRVCGREPRAGAGRGRSPRQPPGKPGWGAVRPAPFLFCPRPGPGSILVHRLVSPGQPGPGTWQRTNLTVEIFLFVSVYCLLQMKCLFFLFFFLFFKQSRKPILTRADLWSQGRWEGVAGCALHEVHGGFYCTSTNSPRSGAVRRLPGLGGCQMGGCPWALPHCPTMSMFWSGLSDLPFPIHVRGCVSAGAATAPWPRVRF